MTSELSSFIKGMEKAGQFAAKTLDHVCEYVKAGMSTNELNQIGEDFTKTHGHTSAPLNYHGFPKSICTSINEVICHGVPDHSTLKDGDIVNIDVTPIVNGFHGDTSRTVMVGKVSDEIKRLVQVAEEAMDKGISVVGPGTTTGDIGFAINKLVTKNGFFAVRDIGGHGIGTKFHMDPFVPSYGKKGRGIPLKPWQCITVEPMVNATTEAMKEHSIPGSTIKWYTTTDMCFSAQFEHTILVTDTGYEILTLGG